MQLTLTLLSSLALVTGALAVENPLSFTTWACNNCASPADTVNGPFFLYGNSKCEGDGDQIFGFVGSNVCRPIVFGARAAYKVICS
ncbi:hypothetical protein AA0117_g8768 [Alternaria alternata]|uniref:Uncharacterized protein n=1 Tax=Alternaria alternata TaxID=5599 RepID=A0A4Q4N8R9_ALTAL|nr:hypothetical protein AA0117_g8768 [Alternaria alternata]RYO54807.1 hypothetical protein AA0116_g9684 [Alternaria tenuissima]